MFSSSIDPIFGAVDVVRAEDDEIPEAMRCIPDDDAIALRVSVDGSVTLVVAHEGDIAEHLRAAMGGQPHERLALNGAYAAWRDAGAADATVVNQLVTGLAGLYGHDGPACRGNIVITRVGADGDARSLTGADLAHLGPLLDGLRGADTDADEDED